jgi:hypothetical protein
MNFSKPNIQKLFLLFLIFINLQTFASKVDSIIKPQVRSSPIQIANLKTAENQYIKCTYGQPMKKGRVVFGNVVPYNKLWRTGANEATEITFSCNFRIGETILPAGTYTLFSIPQKDIWTIILNSVLGQWGDFSYDSTKNVLRTEVQAIKNSDIYEGFTIQINDKQPNFDINLLWDDVKVTIPIEVIGIIEEPKKKKKKRR